MLITGGSRGLGLRSPARSPAEGGRLALLARDQDELEARLRGAARARRRSHRAPLRLLDRGQSLGAVESVVDRYGGIDVLINNAGIIEVGPLDNMTPSGTSRRRWAALLGAV